MIYTLGGNQRDQVNISAYPADKLLTIRRMERTSKAQSTTHPGRHRSGHSDRRQALLRLSGGLDPARHSTSFSARRAVVGLALIWIVRERIKRWADGDR
jgi:hypothetical protein